MVILCAEALTIVAVLAITKVTMANSSTTTTAGDEIAVINNDNPTTSFSFENKILIRGNQPGRKRNRDIATTTINNSALQASTINDSTEPVVTSRVTRSKAKLIQNF